MSKEAMNHAIDVLKDSQDYKMGRAMTVEAVEALEEALAKQEQFDLNEDLKAWQKDGSPIPVKQEQGEPVAWRWQMSDVHPHLWEVSEKPHPMALRSEPLYTTPQQRKWVGLSVFEINDLVENTEYEDYRTLVEKVEAKLKEKNNA